MIDPEDFEDFFEFKTCIPAVDCELWVINERVPNWEGTTACYNESNGCFFRTEFDSAIPVDVTHWRIK